MGECVQVIMNIVVFSRCIYVYVCVFVWHMCGYPWRLEDEADNLELELKLAVSSLMWMLDTNVLSSRTAVQSHLSSPSHILNKKLEHLWLWNPRKCAFVHVYVCICACVCVNPTQHMWPFKSFLLQLWTKIRICQR